jgi:predicted secreted acid phosphatase
LAARRGKKRALIAVGHSILKSVYHVLSENIVYKEFGANYLSKKLEAKRKAYLKKELEKLGYRVQILPNPEKQTG